MGIDTKGWNDIKGILKSQGWKGTTKQLQTLMAEVEEASKIRHIQASWLWGVEAKSFVFSLVQCAQKRGASVFVTSMGSGSSNGPHMLFSFPKDSRLQALQIQVKSDRVYIVRKFQGDWRSARNFYPRKKTQSRADE